jgi:hypothetical protein
MTRSATHRSAAAGVALAIVLSTLRAVPAMAVAPANGQIAYYQQGGSGASVHRIDPNGTNDAVVVSGDGDRPAWSPDGQQLAFTSARHPGPQSYDVYRIAPDGTAPVPLATDATDDQDAAWSPGGGQIAFTSLRSGNYDVWVMNADGSTPVNLTASSSSLDMAPTWSPDGTKIAFRSKRAGSFDIWVMDANGDNPVQLTNDHAFDADPDWSPDGSLIAYTHVGGTAEIWTVTPDGADQTVLTTGSDPSWSPDGARIAFTNSSDIYTATAAGTDVVNVTNTPTVADDHADWGTYQAGPLTYPLWVTVSGGGSGSVGSSPAGIACGATCAAAFAPATQVTLTATPGPGSVLSGWSGEGCAGTGACVVSMTQARNVVATFAVGSFTLSVTKIGTGDGVVSSSPGGIACGATCSAAFAPSTSVTLSASPDVDATFDGWSGGCTGTGSCQVTMDQARSVSASFTRTSAPVALTVTKAGTGGGVVLSSPAGIDCGSTCSASFPLNTTVTLTARATGALSRFAGWSDSGCAGVGACVVTMDQARSVTATFDHNNFPAADPQSVTLSEDGTATIQLTGSDPDGDAVGGFRVARDPLHGTVSLTGSIATYRPTANYSGPDSFTFNLSDGGLRSNNALVSVTVTPVNDPPSAPLLTRTTAEDTVLKVTMDAYDVDPDLLTYTGYAVPITSRVQFTGNVISFTPGRNYTGDARVSYCVSDGVGAPVCNEIDITVTPTPDIPVVRARADTAVEGAATEFAYGFTDPDGQAIAKFTAIIDWGDGTTSHGHIENDTGGDYSVFATHTYKRWRTYDVVVRVVDARDGTGDAATSIKVSDAPISTSPFDNKGHGTAGQPWGPFVIGCFQDANPYGAMSEFTASVAWGDGTTTKNLTISKATGTCKAGGWQYSVIGPAHTFSKAKTYTYVYKVLSTGGSKDQNSGQIVIK